MLLAPTIVAAQVNLRRYHIPDSSHTAAEIAGLPANCSQPVSPDWISAVNRLRWVAYSSPRTDLQPGYRQPTAQAIYGDLLALRRANFNALVTYASAGIMGKDFLEIAESLGFKGVILGIWNPRNQDELRNAERAAGSGLVLGFSIGNEGLYGAREPYALTDVCSAIAGLRSDTGLPAPTSEQIDDYAEHPELLAVGDWIFPIAHPYWHNTKDPQRAVAWIRESYAEIDASTTGFVFIKEQGLPTAGAYGLSQESHDQYYRKLAETQLPFVYFEGFDQPSKSHAAVEPHWGIFGPTRRPKLLGWNLMGYRKFLSLAAYDGSIRGCPGSPGQGCEVESAAEEFIVGVDHGGQHYRGFLAFSTGGLPDAALLSSIKLKIRSPGLEGLDPLSWGELVVEICKPYYGLDWTLQPGDYGAGLKCEVVGAIRSRPHEGWYSVEFLPSTAALINLSGTTQFRLSVKGNGRAARSYIKFYSGDADERNRPVLVIRYDLP